MDKGFRNLGEIMVSDKILREVEYSSSTISKVHNFKIKGGDSIKLTVPPTVYPPRRDTELFLKGLNCIKMQTGHLVEIGCGSGAISIAMALGGWNVTAFDVNPLAVVATIGNSEVAGVDDCVTVEEGGVGGENWKLPKDADLVVWNLPYLAPDLENMLGPMEEAAMTDEANLGWSEKLLHIVNDMSKKDTIFALLMSSDSNPKNSPLSWTKKGWARRTLATERVGNDTLEVVAFWRPGFGSVPEHIEVTNSTMDEARNLPKVGWQRIRSEEQINGRGRRGANWHSKQGDMTASWSIGLDEINQWAPGLLQVSIGAIISETLGIQLKWPNDLIFQQKKCGGILVESSTSEGRIRIGVGLNKDAREIEGISYAGWEDYFGDISAKDMFQIIDASIASILDSSPPIESSRNILWQQKSWIKLSEILSRGVTAQYDEQIVNVVGLSDTGELKAFSATSKHDIQDVGAFSITF